MSGRPNSLPVAMPTFRRNTQETEPEIRLCQFVDEYCSSHITTANLEVDVPFSNLRYVSPSTTGREAAVIERSVNEYRVLSEARGPRPWFRSQPSSRVETI